MSTDGVFGGTVGRGGMGPGGVEGGDRTGGRKSRAEMRECLQRALDENASLRAAVARLVMDAVEVETLKSRIVDLEWALDVVAEDATRVRHDALDALAVARLHGACFEDVCSADGELLDEASGERLHNDSPPQVPPESVLRSVEQSGASRSDDRVAMSCEDDDVGEEVCDNQR